MGGEAAAQIEKDTLNKLKKKLQQNLNQAGGWPSEKSKERAFGSGCS